MPPSQRRAVAAPAAALLALLLVVAAGCAHLPRIIVLEDPLSPDEHLALGLSYESRQELDLAAREYELALKQERASFQARFNLGNVRLAQKRYDEARQEYLAALAVRPGDPEATNNLAWAAILSGRGREDALRRMEAVLATPADRSPPLLDTLGVLLGTLSRDTEAELVFAEAGARCEEQDSACTEEVRRELHEHGEAARARAPAPTATP